MANFRPFSGKKGKQDTINGGKPFGFSWFIPTIIKYKKQFACVLIAVLFIQLLGILTPLMTQVVVDQVLSHHAIAIHCPNTSIDQIIESAKIAGAHDFIMELDEGYDTVIGEKGISLSGGQKQRIAIARAIINNPRILIFDEATSALDYESESIIQNNLKEICKGRTVLIIAHRLSNLSLADEILVIDKGELKERGSHDVLMKMNGLYAYLYNQQSKGEIYDDFIMDIRRQAILDYWWHERESIKEGNCTRNWTPDQIESIMNISTETGMCEKQAGRPN